LSKRRLICTTIAMSLAAAIAAQAQPPATPPATPAAPATPRPPPAPDPAWGKLAYDAKGPNRTVTEPGEVCTIVRPETLGAGGLRHPIILWGNGTGQRPTGYLPILETLASWGFVVGAANTTNAGTGIEMLSCLDWLTAKNGEAGSVYQGKLDPSKVGASGHSQGGGGTLMAGRDPRVKATAPLQPYTIGLGYVAGAHTLQNGPVLLISGGNDTIARIEPNQKPVFDQTTQPILWATLKDSSHLVPMRSGGVYPGIITAWFRYQLMGDPAAAAMFQGPACAYCTSPDWTLQRKGGA